MRRIDFILIQCILVKVVLFQCCKIVRTLIIFFSFDIINVRAFLFNNIVIFSTVLNINNFFKRFTVSHYIKKIFFRQIPMRYLVRRWQVEKKKNFCKLLIYQKYLHLRVTGCEKNCFSLSCRFNLTQYKKRTFLHFFKK